MIDPYIERIINLFTPAEWKALVWLMVCTIAATHTIKLLWRLLPIKGGTHWNVQLAAVVSGFSMSYFIWPEQSVPWFVVGVMAGPASSLTFLFAFALLKRYAPSFAAAINADRRKQFTDSACNADGYARRDTDKENR